MLPAMLPACLPCCLPPARTPTHQPTCFRKAGNTSRAQACQAQAKLQAAAQVGFALRQPHACCCTCAVRGCCPCCCSVAAPTLCLLTER